MARLTGESTLPSPSPGKLEAAALERNSVLPRRSLALSRGTVDQLYLAVRLAVFAALLWVLLTQVYLVTQASGSEMFPAVKDGDLVLGIRLEKAYAKNDVVVYERSGRLRVGRVLARGGDIVTLSESGVCGGQRLGTGRRHPLPHLPQISAQLPLRCAGGQRLHSGRLPHTGRGQP